MAKAIRILLYNGEQEWLDAVMEDKEKAKAGAPIKARGRTIKELWRRVYGDEERLEKPLRIIMRSAGQELEDELDRLQAGTERRSNQRR